MAIGFTSVHSEQDIKTCAKLMSAYEPWIILGRTYEQSLQILQDPLAEVFIAKSDGLLIGFAIIKNKGAFTGYIQTILITEAFQGQGIGTLFIKYLEEIIFRQHPNVFICASSFNGNALKLYNKLGYSLIGELKDYIIAEHSEMLLRKSIAPIAQYNMSR